MVVKQRKTMKAKSPSLIFVLKLVSIVGMLTMLTDDSTQAVAGQTVRHNLSASQIFQESREVYASLSTYSDQGQVVAVTGLGSATNTFTIRLARPNFYRIEWVQQSDSSFPVQQTSIQAVWSLGACDLLDRGWGEQKQYNRKIALLNATGPSGDATATIPLTFFHIRWADELNALSGLGFSANRLADENVGGVDCYVITWASQGQTKTLWIGKRDFLVRKIRTSVSAQAMRTALEQCDPEIVPALGGFTSTETHTNIIVNTQFTQTDFVPSFPTSSPVDSE
jgi:outer membrane lipoprotein-sorting protein